MEMDSVRLDGMHQEWPLHHHTNVYSGNLVKDVFHDKGVEFMLWKKNS